MNPCLVSIGVILAVVIFASWRKAKKDAAEAQRRAAELAERFRQRRERLIATYGERTANLIIQRQLWQGATREMVVEMFGQPVRIDERVFKAKTRHVLKYFPGTRNHFALKVTLENDLVVGWEGDLVPR